MSEFSTWNLVDEHMVNESKKNPVSWCFFMHWNLGYFCAEKPEYLHASRKQHKQDTLNWI